MNDGSWNCANYQYVSAVFFMVFWQKYFAIIHRFFFVKKNDDSVIDMIIRIIKEKKTFGNENLDPICNIKLHFKE